MPYISIRASCSSEAYDEQSEYHKFPLMLKVYICHYISYFLFCRRVCLTTVTYRERMGHVITVHHLNSCLHTQTIPSGPALKFCWWFLLRVLLPWWCSRSFYSPQHLPTEATNHLPINTTPHNQNVWKHPRTVAASNLWELAKEDRWRDWSQRCKHSQINTQSIQCALYWPMLESIREIVQTLEKQGQSQVTV